MAGDSFEKISKDLLARICETESAEKAWGQIVEGVGTLASRVGEVWGEFSGRLVKVAIAEAMKASRN